MSNLLFAVMDHLSTEPSIDFRDDLKNVLEKARIGQTLDALKECLRPHAHSRNDLTILVGRWRSLNNKDIRGTLSMDEYGKEENKIRDSLIRFIDGLTEEEVYTAGRRKEKKVVVKYRAGKVHYFLPNRMELNKEVECEVKISVDDELLDQAASSEATLHERNICVSDAMSVILKGRSNSPFDIEALNEEIQMVTNHGSTTWTFFVNPLSEGTHLLLLKVAMVKNDQGILVKKEEVLRERIQVIAHPVEHTAARKKELTFSFLLPVVMVEPIAPPPVVDDKSIFQKILAGAGGAGALALVAYLAFSAVGPPEPSPPSPPPSDPDVVVVEPPAPVEPVGDTATTKPPPPPKWPPYLRVPAPLPILVFANPMYPWHVVVEGKVYERVNILSYEAEAVEKATYTFIEEENEHIDTIIGKVPYRLAKHVRISNAQNPNSFAISQMDGAYELIGPDSQLVLLVHASQEEAYQAKYQRYRMEGNDVLLDLKNHDVPIRVSYDLGNEVTVPAPKNKIEQARHLLETSILGNKMEIDKDWTELGATDSLGWYKRGFAANYLNDKVFLKVTDNCSDFDTTFAIPASQLLDTAAIQLLMPIKGIKTNKIQLKKGKEKSLSELIPEPALKRKTVKVFTDYDMAKKEKARVRIGEIKTNESGWFAYKIKPDASVAGVSIKWVEEKSGDYYLFSVNPSLFKRKSFGLVFKNNLWEIGSVIEFGDDFCGAIIRSENRVLRLRKTPFFIGERQDIFN